MSAPIGVSSRSMTSRSCVRAGLSPRVPKPQRGSAVRKGFFAKDEFRYEPARDVFVCPAGETLAPRHQGKLRDLKKIEVCFYATRLPGHSRFLFSRNS